MLPLDDRKTERLNVENRPSLTEGRTTFTYPNLLRLPEGAAPDLKHRNHTITAKVVIPEGGAEGMLLTQGGRFAGFGLFVKDGKLVYHYNLAGVERYAVTSDEPVPTGEVTLKAVYETDADKPFAGATVTLFANDRRSARAASRRASRTASPSTRPSTSASTPARRSPTSYDTALPVHRQARRRDDRAELTRRAGVGRGPPVRLRTPRRPHPHAFTRRVRDVQSGRDGFRASRPGSPDVNVGRPGPPTTPEIADDGRNRNRDARNWPA